jgi:antitoxin component YwqK of YwqJK toxin-antitoxin module
MRQFTAGHGVETGVWRDYHANGQLAAEGTYSKGEKIGTSQYWTANGRPEAPETF